MFAGGNDGVESGSFSPEFAVLVVDFAGEIGFRHSSPKTLERRFESLRVGFHRGPDQLNFAGIFHRAKAFDDAGCGYEFDVHRQAFLQ